MSGAVRPEFAAIGQRLRESRERRGMSREAVLERLHCTPEVLAALEQGNFDRLGAAVFVRGHLKRYAELVGEPADDLLAQWSGAGAASEPDISRRPQAPRSLELRRWGRAAAYAVLALVLAGLAWAVLRFATPAVRAVAPSPAQPQALPALREPPIEPELLAPAAVAAAVPPPSPAPAPAPAPAPESAPAPAPAGGTEPTALTTPAVSESPAPSATDGSARVAVTGSFSEACWVDVTDATGKRLYYGLVPAGGRVSLAGVAPLGVLIGVQSAARLEVAGRSVAIPPGAPGLRSTRFRLAADGTVLPPTN